MMGLPRRPQGKRRLSHVSLQQSSIASHSHHTFKMIDFASLTHLTRHTRHLCRTRIPSVHRYYSMNEWLNDWTNIDFHIYLQMAYHTMENLENCNIQTNTYLQIDLCLCLQSNNAIPYIQNIFVQHDWIHFVSCYC